MHKPARLCLVLLSIGAVALITGPTGAGADDQPNATANPTCGGISIPKADGGTWTCTFDDEFNGTGLDRSTWNVETTAASRLTGGAACFLDTPQNVSVADGTLNLTVRKQAQPIPCTSSKGTTMTDYTSGMVDTFGTFAQAYGRFQVRAKLPATAIQGLQESFWLWPQNPQAYGPVWPMSGEIDIAESYSRYSDHMIPYVHYLSLGLDPNVTSYGCGVPDIDQFHTYTAVWDPTSITISYDGKTCITDNWGLLGASGGQPFNQSFMIALTQALGIGKNAFIPGTTPLPATTSIDYVRVWK
ncbi:MAG: glycoside hydrolase family 16 protein [Jatrophihabitantaceae bacterium]